MKSKFIFPILILFASITALFASSVTPSMAFAQEIEPTPLPEPFSDPSSNTFSSGTVFRRQLYTVPYSIFPNDHFYFTRPFQPDNDFWLNKDYRYGDINPISENPHTGIDIELEMNTPVIAAGPGTIVWAGFGLLSDDPTYKGDAYGLAVSIEHDFGYEGQSLFTIYAHNNEILVEIGDHVDTGDILALSGNTGFSTGPHTHFEIRIGENNMYQAYNPELWIAPEIGKGVLLGRVTTKLGTHLFDHEIRLYNLETSDSYNIKTYNTMEFMNRDPYFKENFAIGDIPAGRYEIVIPYYGYDYHIYIDIQPGTLNYIRFEGSSGIHTEPPQTYTHSFFAD